MRVEEKVKGRIGEKGSWKGGKKHKHHSSSCVNESLVAKETFHP